jgi:hypothetical protein
MPKTKSTSNTKSTSKRTKNANSKTAKRNKRVWQLRIPQSNIMSQFEMTDNNITSFKRFIKSPMDCFINALQLMGLIDTMQSNMLRISAGNVGFSKEQIEKIFILQKGNNFTFKPTKNYIEFAETIKNNLKPGHAVFAGYTGHVFILARFIDGRIMFIDPQINTFCDVEKCENNIKNKGDEYFLLFNSEEKLNNSQLETLGFKI